MKGKNKKNGKMDVMIEKKKRKGMQGIYFVDLKVIYRIKDFVLIILYYI